MTGESHTVTYENPGSQETGRRIHKKNKPKAYYPHNVTLPQNTI